MFNMSLRRSALLVLVLLGIAANAGEVTPERAVKATSAWIARSPSPVRLPTGEVRTFALNGADAYHLVALHGGGWVMQPADDRHDPVLAWCIDADAAFPDEDDGSPVWDILAVYAGVE